jgi:release factor glutamine methyltransferase
MTTVGDAQVAARTALGAAGIGSAALEARLLLAAAIGCAPDDLFGAARERDLAPEAARRLESLLQRRLAREPVAYILGRKEFWSLPLRVSPATLVPRPESETLIEAALAAVSDRTRPLTILDCGTGSGCLLLALLSELPRAWGVGIDRSAAALAVAADNARTLGVSARTGFVCGDWAAGIAGRFDLIVANPPYVPDAEIPRLAPEVAQFEPRGALAAGPDGLGAYRALLPHLSRLLTAEGVAFVEVGDGQAEAVTRIGESCRLHAAAAWPDLQGIARCLELRPVCARGNNKSLGNQAVPV